MRTTVLGQARQTILNLRAASARRGRATQQLSSGLRVTLPSDSPIDAGGVVRTRTDIARITQSQSNFAALKAELRAVDGSLSEAVNVLQRTLSLGTQGATATQTAQSREVIQQEIDALLQQMVSIGNTVHGGRRVFAGSDESQVPFVFDPATGSVSYQGNAVGRSLTFPDGRPARISLPGDSIFLNPDELIGEGRTPATAGTPPALPAGLGVSFSGAVQGSISVDLPGFFVAPAAPSSAAAGDEISVTFTSSDGLITETITTTPLAGGETAAAISSLLNDAVTANPELSGLVSFSDQGGALKLTVSDTAGVGFDFASTSTGAVVSGLEAGGTVGGYSAEEIAAALNAQVALDPALAGAAVLFTARDGEVTLDSNVDLTATIVDFDRGTAFRSGLAGERRIGGVNSANVFGALEKLSAALGANDQAAIEEAVQNLQLATDHVAKSQGFYGAALNRVEVTLDNLQQLEVVNRVRLSAQQDTDVLAAIGELQAASAAEELAIQIAGRDRPNLLDVIG